jgi:hypothetical protein
MRTHDEDRDASVVGLVEEATTSIVDADTTYVYLLHSKTEPLFKVGLSRNLLARIAEVGGQQEIDPERSIAFACGGDDHEGKAARFERIVHLLFQHDRRNHPARRSGFTEWFATDCFDEVVLFIDGMSSRLGVRRIHAPMTLLLEHLNAAAAPAHAPKPIPTRDERARKKALREQQDFNAAVRDNEIALAAVRRVVDELLVRELVCAWVPGRYTHDSSYLVLRKKDGSAFERDELFTLFSESMASPVRPTVGQSSSVVVGYDLGESHAAVEVNNTIWRGRGDATLDGQMAAIALELKRLGTVAPADLTVPCG